MKEKTLGGLGGPRGKGKCEKQPPWYQKGYFGSSL